MIQKEIDALQIDFASYESVKKFIILSEPLSIEKGELTPSLKIKRNVLEKNYKKQIDALYEE
jgi:long-chain acyl-CoA synthetase